MNELVARVSGDGLYLTLTRTTTLFLSWKSPLILMIQFLTVMKLGLRSTYKQ